MIGDPTEIPGLRLWLSSKAAPLGVTTQWNDLSGHGHHGTAPVTDTASVVNTGEGMVMHDGPPFEFDPSLFWGPGHDTPLVAGEIFASTVHTGYGGIFAMGGPGAGFTHHPYFDGRYYENFGSGSRPDFMGLPDGQAHRFHVLSAPGKWQARINETVAYNAEANTVQWPNPTFKPLVGSGGGPGGTYLYDGSISCVLLYERRLSDSERAEVDEWLAANMDGGLPVPKDPEYLLALGGSTPLGDTFRVGGQTIDRIYLGDKKVWPPTVPT